MGVYCYGVKPKWDISDCVMEIDFPIFLKYRDMSLEEKSEHPDWKKEGMTFYEQHGSMEDLNVGFTFLCNWWGWRPLWKYICEQCKDVLTWEDECEGGWNNGHLIDEKKCELISKILTELIESGHTKSYETNVFPSLPEAENYFFGEEIVIRFRDFVGKCGGFEIC